MIIKKIICTVNENQKEIFYEYQKQWKSLSKGKGFLGQIGGWSINEPLTACIYSFWDNQSDYEKFMEELHDGIFLNSGQENSYESIDVSLYQEELRIPGVLDNIVNILKNSIYIRVAVAQVKDNKMNHFIDMQKNIWNIGMQKSAGMLGGTFAYAQKENNEFLVVTAWENELYHQAYMEQHFHDLLKRAEPKNDVLELKGEQFKVEEEWRVSPINDEITRFKG